MSWPHRPIPCPCPCPCALALAHAVVSTLGAKLVAIADPVAAAANAVKAAHGCGIRSIDAILASANIDAVVICTQTDTQADLIEKFTDAGKAMFCEKPVDLSLARFKACLASVATKKGTVMVGFNRRFAPDFMAVKAVIDVGTLGDAVMITITITITITSRDPGAPPADYITRPSCIFRDMTIHYFDMARWRLSAEV